MKFNVKNTLIRIAYSKLHNLHLIKSVCSKLFAFHKITAGNKYQEINTQVTQQTLATLINFIVCNLQI